MYFEEFNTGDSFNTRSRLITGTDVDLFAALTGATNPVFLADECGRAMGYKGRMAPGMLTLSLAVGLQYSAGLLDHARAFLGISDLRFLAPLNPGDAIKCQTEVTNKKDMGEDNGIVTFNWSCENQDRNTVLQAEATFMILKQPKGNVAF